MLSLDRARLCRRRGAAAACAFLALTMSFGSGSAEGRVTISTNPGSPAEGFISSADVLARVDVLRDELDLIRREMGEPPPTLIEIIVRGAQPRETYFHAYTVSDKAHRLAFEFTGRPERPLGILLAAETTPVNVYAVVSEALESIRSVKRALDISQSVQEQVHDPRTTSSQVLSAIIQANRELNNLLYQEYSPLDVHEQVSVSINFAARLLEQFAGSTPEPDPPAFERGKTSADVFNRLVLLFEDISAIAQSSGESTMVLKVRPTAPANLTSSDAHDIASMLFAELAYLYSLLKDPEAVDEPRYPPHRILPSHVYQQAGVLEAQLDQLKGYADEFPTWLTGQ